MTASLLNLNRWISAARPRTLPLALAPALAGIALGAFQTGHLALPTALVTLLAAVAIQIGTNLHNDASDFERGTDTADRVGPQRAAAQGWFTVAQVKRAAHLAFVIALVLGAFLCLRGGWPILLLGLASLVAGYAYTGGAHPIAYGPFGELFVLLFFGIAAVAGSHYLQTLAWSPTAIGLGLTLGLPAAAVLLLNNYRDRDTDAQAGRRTLCHYLGPQRARLLYALLLVMPFPLLFLLDLPGSPWPSLLILPLPLVLIRRIQAGEAGLALNPLLGKTAVFEAALVVMLVIGFTWSAA